MVDQARSIIERHYQKEPPNSGKILVHCWRGGMRSASVAWLFNKFEMNAFTLFEGYKVKTRIFWEFSYV
jgi:tRNA 2-selenouridine synthase